MSWFRRVQSKPACILLLVVTVTFLHAQFYYLCRTSFIFVFSQRTILLLQRIRVNKLVRLLNFLGNRRPVACVAAAPRTRLNHLYSPIYKGLERLRRRLKASNLTQDHFSVAQVIIVRVFFFHFSLHSFVFQCTVKVSVLYKNNFLYANCPFHSLWSRERQLPAVTSKQLTLFP